MKYKVLLKFLRLLIYVKRFFWWTGAGIYFISAGIIAGSVRLFIFIAYKARYALKRLGVTSTKEWFFGRGFLQSLVFLALLLISLGQTKFFPKRDLSFVGQKAMAYTLFGADQDVIEEEIVAASPVVTSEIPSWKAGTIAAGPLGGSVALVEGPILGTVVAGGTAFTNPIIIPGASLGMPRNSSVNYTIQSGDSLGGIAYDFGVSIPTVMWANNLTLRSIIQPGDVLKIPPTTGIIHTVKKGDTIKRIATTYEAETSRIITFNHLKEDGTDLLIGEQIMVPDGVKPKERALVAATQTKAGRTAARTMAVPPPSRRGRSASGFTWPTASHLMTQYYGISHHAIDIGGPWQTPTYAAKAGVVEVAQCGWNSGYGCYIIIDHGDSVKTLYGHHSQLLVSPGDVVDAGQTIALMGNTGHVRGITGIHLHFEIQVKGVRVNPLGYVR